MEGKPRDYYAKVFQPEPRGRGVLVIVDANDGEVFNLFASEPRYLKRKGYANRIELAWPGEQPPDGVLQAIAAADSLPDRLYPTAFLPDVNPRLSRYFSNREPSAVAGALRETIGLQRLAKWDAPVRAYIEGLILDLERGEFDDAALDRLENAIRAMPPDLADAEALAKFLEQAMAGAMIEGAEDEARRVAGG